MLTETTKHLGWSFRLPQVRPACKALVAAVVVFAMLGAFAHPSTAADASYQVLAEKGVMVPMRDGVQLATDIYRPAEKNQAVAGRFPVVLSRTPYGKSSSIAKAYVPYGYIVILQDTRGRGKSEGTWTWMSDDVQDGYDMVEWIAAQPWSNGKVGMMGCSYVGATQHLAAMSRPPHLTAIAPSNPSINHGIGSIIYDGAFRLRICNWILGNAANGSRQAQDPALKEELVRQSKNANHYLRNLPIRRGLTPLRMAPEYENMLIEMLERRRNDEFWRFSNMIDYVDEHKDLPVFMIGGWYDLFSSSTSETYMALRRTKKFPAHLIMGPWSHCGSRQAHAQVDFGPDAAVDMNGFHRAWFDRWLKEDTEKFGREVPFRTPVRLFVMGTGDGHKTKEGQLYHGGYWRDAADYPLPEAVPTKYYLRQGGGLTPESPTAQTASTSFEFDPKNPVPTIGGCIVGSMAGAWNQWGGNHIWNWQTPLPLSVRNDIVVFMTPPLSEDTTIVGPIRVKLWASSSAVDTDFTAKLLDVYPSSSDFPAGFDLIMGDGIVRARYRPSNMQDELLTPGKIYEFDVKLDPCSNVFKKGHRIRVDISSSNFPRFDVNPNSGESPNDYRRMITAVNTIHHDSAHPSHIVLPLIPVKGDGHE